MAKYRTMTVRIPEAIYARLVRQEERDGLSPATRARAWIMQNVEYLPEYMPEPPRSPNVAPSLPQMTAQGQDLQSKMAGWAASPSGGSSKGGSGGRKQGKKKR